MKKIVSTMFKCGAIYASINMVFADGDKTKARSLCSIPTNKASEIESFWGERSTEERLGLTSDSRLIIEGRTLLGHRLKESIFLTKKQIILSRSTTEEILKPQSKARRHRKSIAPSIPRIDDTYIPGCNYNGDLDSLLSEIWVKEKSPEKTSCKLLLAIAKQVQSLYTRGMGKYSLYPKDTIVHWHPEQNNLWMKFSSTEESLEQHTANYGLMQVVKDPRRAFACLVLYTMYPDIRSYFANDCISIKDGNFLYFSSGKWYILDRDDIFVKLAQLLIRGKILMESTIEILEKPNDYEDLVNALEDSIEQPDPARRTEAREVIAAYNNTVFIGLLKVLKPKFMKTAQLLKMAENGDEEKFRAGAALCIEEIGFLQEICSTKPVEICKITGKIHVSDDTLRIISAYPEILTASSSKKARLDVTVSSVQKSKEQTSFAQENSQAVRN